MPPRCPSVDTDTGAWCELADDHDANHQAVVFVQQEGRPGRHVRICWLIALRCQLTVDGQPCAKLDGHVTPCVPRPKPAPVAPSLVRSTTDRGQARAAKAQTYFIQMGDGGPIKIGVSADPQRRMKDLSVASPHELRLLATMPGNHERALHERLATSRRPAGGSEWFDPTAEVLAAVQAAR
jgi:hypothetical protein